MRTQSSLCGLALVVLYLCAFSASARNSDTYTAKTIYSFCPTEHCSGGAYPFAGLVRDSLGNFYGVTARGGDRDNGTVFELSPAGKKGGKWRYRRLYSFCPIDCRDGQSPQKPLIIDSAGNLYGVTAGGGQSAYGVVFELEHAGIRKWKYHIIHSFCSLANCSDGGGNYDMPSGLTYAGAASGLPYDGVSPLYGTNYLGGAYGRGVVYSLTRSGKNQWRHKVVHQFCPHTECPDGAYPNPPTADGNGNIFGTTQDGGLGPYTGIAYKLSLTGGKWRENVLYKFCSAADCDDGKYPIEGLAIDSAGNLFGATVQGGTAIWSGGFGVIFRLSHDKDGWHETVLHSFCSVGDCDDGVLTIGKPVLDDSGNLFGATETHGSDFGEDDGGTIYKLQGSNYQVIYTFCTQNSCAEPENHASADLYVDSTGNIFGTASFDGDYGWGYAFELTP